MTPTIAQIKRAAAAHFGVSVLEIDSDRRSKHVVRARQMAMAAAREATLHSLPSIGHQFNGRDHTTVLHAVRRVEGRRRDDPTVASDLEAIIQLADEEPRDEPEAVIAARPRQERFKSFTVTAVVRVSADDPDIAELLADVRHLECVRYSAFEKKAIERVIASACRIREARLEARRRA